MLLLNNIIIITIIKLMKHKPINSIFVSLMNVGNGSHDMVGHDVIAVILMHGWSVIHMWSVCQRLHLSSEWVIWALHWAIMRKAVVVLFKINDKTIHSTYIHWKAKAVNSGPQKLHKSVAALKHETLSRIFADFI